MRVEANPIGEVKLDENIELYIQSLNAEWDEQREAIPWYKFWKRITFTPVVDFLLKTLDDLIAYVDDVLENGADKKATVLRAVEMVYEYIVKEAMPIWLRPFAGKVKEIVILQVISPAIDWMVDKYRNGDWRKKEAEEVVAQWQLKAQMFGVPGDHRPK
jgi:hypothetical protein